MLKGQDVLADGILMYQETLKMFLEGFDEGNRTRQTKELPNHLAWTLGHVALYMHMTAEQFDGEPTPETDFYKGDGSGDPERYDIEAICFGSTPVDDSARYPSLKRGTEIFDAACGHLASAVRKADEKHFEKTATWGEHEFVLGPLVQRIMHHCGCHTGQIMDLRRALGFARVIG